MADVQLEHGFSRIANELLEALARMPLNGAQFRILLVVIRECYGRNGGRKTAPLSAHDLARLTGLVPRTLRRELKALIDAQIVERTGPPGECPRLGLQKDYERWAADQSGQRTKVATADQSGRESGPKWPKSADQSGRYKEEKYLEEQEGAAHKPSSASPLVVCRDYAFSRYQDQHGGQKPNWTQADFVQLAALFRRKGDLSIETFCTHWDGYVTTDDPFHLKQGGSLRYFCANFDKFDPAILEVVSPKAKLEAYAKRLERYAEEDAKVIQ
jgi:phage replication O-like protein O